MIKAIFFIISFLILLTGFLIYPKTKEKIELFSWIVLSVLIVIIFDTFAAGICNMVNIPVNIVLLGVSNIFLGIPMIIYSIRNKENIQKYEIDLKNLFVFGIMYCAICFIAYQRFGTDLYYFRYSNGDSARHLAAAMNTYNNSFVENMYFTHLGDSIFMQCAFFLETYELYKAFIAYDIFLLCMQSFMFWILIQDFFKTKILYIIGVFLTFIYVLGYPLNNFIHGTEYWGAGVLIVSIIIYILKLLKGKKYSEKLLLGMLLLANVSLSVAYMLFVPSVYVGEFLCLSIDYIKNNKNIKKYVSRMFIIFVFGTLFFVYYGLNGMLGGVSNSVSTTQYVTSLGGWVYKDLYVIFIPMSVFTILYFVRVWKNKINDEVSCIYIISLVQLLFCLALIIAGKMQTYYYYKEYYVIMLLIVYVMIKEISERWNENKEILCSYMSVYFVVFFISVFGIENKLNEKNNELANPIKGSTLFELYTSNITMIKEKWSNVSDNEQDLYKIIGELRTNVNNDIPYLANVTDAWNDIGYIHYYNMTNQAQSTWSSYRVSDDNIVLKEDVEMLDYITIMRDSPFYCNNFEWLQTKDIIFDNGIQMVYKLN